MVRNEMTEDGRIRHYSDEDYKIRQVETGNVYDDAVDYLPCAFTYAETDIMVEHAEDGETVAGVPIAELNNAYRAGVNSII